jgi:hypothetical protein
VRQFYLGEHGTLEAGDGARGHSPPPAQEVHVEVAQADAEQGAAFVEAPVLRSSPAADAGILLLLMGGEAVAIDGPERSSTRSARYATSARWGRSFA